jgi:hypothetical protein
MPGQCECCKRWVDSETCETCFVWNDYFLQLEPLVVPVTIPKGYTVRKMRVQPVAEKV